MRYYSEATVHQLVLDIACGKRNKLIISNICNRYPSIEIKEPHGELVDREQIYKSCTSADWKITEDTEKIAVALQNAPVVLEASK